MIVGARIRATDLDLDLLSGLHTDEQLVGALDVLDDRLVELVATNADRLRHNDATKRDDSNLSCAAADVDDHVARWFRNREPGANCSGHRLFDQVGNARTGRECGLFNRTLLDAGHTRGHADNNARMSPAVLMNLVNEMAEHFLRHLKVGNHTVFEWTNGHNRCRSTTEHALGFNADSEHGARHLIKRHHGWLGQHDATPTHVDERIRRPEIDRHVSTAEAKHPVPDTDEIPLAARGAASGHRFYVVSGFPPTTGRLRPSVASNSVSRTTGNPTTLV